MNDLTSEQRAILGAVLLQANVSHADIARLLGIREHTVRRTVDLFFERKIVLVL
jgi:DNA-directed RNA polymerase specialized sigma24 family protein